MRFEMKNTIGTALASWFQHLYCTCTNQRGYLLRL